MRTRRYQFFITSQLFLGLVLPFAQMAILGGFGNASAVIIWSIISAMGALFLYEYHRAVKWWVAYFAVLVLSGLIAPYTRVANNLPAAVVTVLFVMNIAGISSIVLLMLNYFIRQKNEAYRLLRLEQEKAEDLLLNILPKEIAAILKNENRTIADQFDGASILFADLVGFTPLSAQMSPVAVVNLLNEIFSYFDGLVEKYGVEKIRTIGDNYMVAAGVPRPRSDHAQVLACLALDMIAYLEVRPAVAGKQIAFRIGINSGPVVGGVIGRKKFVYDIWGDAVNIASRMESQGLAGKIQITEETYRLIHPGFVCEPRGSVTVKGRGVMRTWFLVGMKPEQDSLRMEDRVTPETRWLAGLVVPFLLVASALLLIWPDQTDRLFAWTIRPGMTSLFIGAGFLAGAYFFIRAAASRRWATTANGFLPVAIFAWMMAIATVLHWDRFHHQNVTFYAWVALYVITPVAVLAIWLRNRGRDPDPGHPDDLRIPRPVRAVLAGLGALMAVVLFIFYIQPGWMASIWPWSLTPLTARVTASFLMISAITELALASSPRWESARVILQGQLIGLALVLLGAARAWGDFDPASPATWIFIGADAGRVFIGRGVISLDGPEGKSE